MSLPNHIKKLKHFQQKKIFVCTMNDCNAKLTEHTIIEKKTKAYAKHEKGNKRNETEK